MLTGFLNDTTYMPEGYTEFRSLQHPFSCKPLHGVPGLAHRLRAALEGPSDPFSCAMVKHIDSPERLGSPEQWVRILTIQEALSEKQSQEGREISIWDGVGQGGFSEDAR